MRVSRLTFRATVRSLLHNSLRLLALIAFVLVNVWALRGIEFNLSALVSPDVVRNLRDFFTGLFPPLLPESERADLLKHFLVTIQMAIVGTELGALLALPLGFLAARTTALGRPLSVGLKTFFNCLRSIPRLIYALLLVRLVGLGPLTGALALAIGSFGTLAKLFAESLENLDPKPIEAVKAVGGRPVQVFAFGMLPQALPQFLALTLYELELNLKESTILGIVGAGGIGFALQTYLRLFQWQQAGALILILMAMVLVVDYLSYRVRQWAE
ncbi:MAG: phosphonate ABC transporter, permease protein PhnE [Abditibacteriales bacterium]|nr:phosphonate ABC transporter, permease protein PhnE [Abditibacteriales bacterium]MDW8366501.1 phosphonate ABC transporter, permease protein PhnE [Abditibacteriales bacterium]